MLDITASATTSLSPEQVIRAAADFSDSREKVWRNAKAKYLVVHDQGADFAEVTEGLRIVGVFWGEAATTGRSPEPSIKPSSTPTRWRPEARGNSLPSLATAAAESKCASNASSDPA